MDTKEPLPLAARPLRIQLIEALASFARALAIYPPTNTRVVANLDALFEAFLAVQAKGKPRPIRILFGSEHLRVDGEEHEVLAGGHVEWLRDRLDRTALVGLELAPTVQRASVVTFCRLLLDNYARSEASGDFELMWKDAPPDMLPIERRFDGDFSGVASDLDLDGASGEMNYLASALASEESIQGHLLALQMALDHDQVGPTLSIDLLDHISRLLPADVMTDLPRVVQMTNRILEEVVKKIQHPETRETGNAEDRRLERMLAVVAQNLFARNDAELTPEVIAGHGRPESRAAGKGHRGDDAISDDLEQMLREFDQLPNFDPQVALFRPEDTYAEQIGVFLHYQLQEEGQLRHEALQRHILVLLSSGTPSVYEVLNEYVDLLRSPQGRQSINAGRLIEVLRDSHLAGLLRTRGVVTADKVLELFPDDFGFYLDALDLREEAQLNELVGVCAALGEDLISGNGQRLVRDQELLRYGRAEAVLASAHAGLTALAQVILQYGSDQHRQLVVDYLRSLELEDKEACLLAIGDSLEYFPREYLTALLDRSSGDDRRKTDKLRQWVSMMLCRYVRNELNETSRRIYAIRLLADFWADEAAELLHGLARQPLFGRSNVPPSVRKAAKETLLAMGAD